jgi:RES domain-containing protein
LRFWRLSSVRRAEDFSGGYGLSNNGRWNTKSRLVTYASTTAALTVLEKRVHVGDPSLLPPQAMVQYSVPDDVAVESVHSTELPPNWGTLEMVTQHQGDVWLDSVRTLILIVPSITVPVVDAPDKNVLFNHRHPDARRVTIVDVVPFNMDVRLFT